MKCAICDQDISLRPDVEVYKEVKGWVGGPKKDSMRLREDTGRVAHADCVAIMAIGQDPTQPDLFS